MSKSGVRVLDLVTFFLDLVTDLVTFWFNLITDLVTDLVTFPLDLITFTSITSPNAKLELYDINQEQEGENPCQDDELGDAVAKDNLRWVATLLIYYGYLDIA